MKPKVYRVRKQGTKRWTKMVQHPPLDHTADDMAKYAAEGFAEENGLENKTVVEVQGIGLYGIRVIMEPEYSAYNISDPL